MRDGHTPDVFGRLSQWDFLMSGTGSLKRALVPWRPYFYPVFMLLHVNGLSSMPPVPWPDSVICVHFG